MAVKLEFLGRNTVYTDIVNLPSTIWMGISVRCYNMDASRTLAMYLTASCSGWTFNSPASLGSVSPGKNHRFNVDDFGYRSRPGSATTNTIVLTLEGWYGGAMLYSDTQNIVISFIKSDDGSWSEDFKDDFDTGTVEGWAQRFGDSINASVLHILSGTHSLRGYVSNSILHSFFGIQLYKSFAIGAVTEAYAIADVYLTKTGSYTYTMALSMEDVGLGRVVAQYPIGQDAGSFQVEDQWFRLVSPLPVDQAVEIAIYPQWYIGGSGGNGSIWMDDFRIISK